jgi:hypothetical protein
VPFLATTGGHGFWKGLNGVRNGVQIYMRGINDISLNKKTGLATMGGGVLAHEVQQFLSDNGKYAGKWHRLGRPYGTLWVLILIQRPVFVHVSPSWDLVSEADTAFFKVDLGLWPITSSPSA